MSKFLRVLILIIIFLVGVALIALPFAYQMFDRTDAASKLMDAFTPIVNTDHATLLKGDLETLGAMQKDTKALLPALAQQLNITEDQMNAMLAQNFKGLAAGMQKMDEMSGRLGGDTKVIGEQVENFAKANELPMKWTPWIFIIPGAVIVVLLLLYLAVRPRKQTAPAAPAAPAMPGPPAL
jgi:hypothetical protein